MIPKGIKVLRSSRNYSEAYTIKTLKECCPAHGYHCEYEAECLERFDAKDWLVYKSERVGLRSEVTDTQRYCDWMPELTIGREKGYARGD